MALRQYIIKRIAAAFVTIFVIALIVFFAMRTIPGDPVTLWLSSPGNINPAEYQQLRHAYGFDQPVYVQYGVWLIGVLHGDWGSSLFSQTPVSTDMLSRMPLTLELIILSFLVSLVIAIPLGIVAAKNFKTKIDFMSSVFVFLGMSIPEFYLGTLFILVFALYLRIVPAAGYVDFASNPVANLQSLIFPILTLGIARAAAIGRLVRSSMLDELGQDYIRTATAKGLPVRLIVWKHALRNALIPVTSLAGLQVGFLIGGTIIVEVVFGLPGLGSFGINAILSRDYPRVQAFIIVVAAIFVISNLVVDLLYPLLDPKVKY